MGSRFVILATVLLVVAACGGDAADPDAVLSGYQEARSAGDLEALMAFYSEDAVVENHPAADGVTATGVTEIRALELTAIGVQGPTGSIEFTDRTVSGNTVTFKDTFHNSRGECYSGGGHRMTVEDGEITRFVWGTEDASDLCE